MDVMILDPAAELGPHKLELRWQHPEWNQRCLKCCISPVEINVLIKIWGFNGQRMFEGNFPPVFQSLSVRLQQDPSEYSWFLSVFNSTFPAHLYLVLPSFFMGSVCFSVGDSLGWEFPGMDAIRMG